MQKQKAENLKYKSGNGLEALAVYRKALIFATAVISLFGHKNKKGQDYLANQILRSSTSIGANIAEGYGRMYSKTFRQFLAVARGSCFETMFWLEIAKTSKTIDKAQYENLDGNVVELIKILSP